MSVSINIDPSQGAASVTSAGSGRSQFQSQPQSQSGSDTAKVATLPSTSTPVSSVGDLASAAKEISNFLSSSKTNIAFAVDHSSGQMVVTITDATTGKTIRQIPNETVLQIARELKQNKSVDNLQFDEKA